MEKQCPIYDNKLPVSPLNPDICVICGYCNECTFYIEKECKGCEINLKPDKMEILEKYQRWKIANPDEGYQFDEIFEVIETRSDALDLLEYALQAYLYAKKHKINFE